MRIGIRKVEDDFDLAVCHNVRNVIIYFADSIFFSLGSGPFPELVTNGDDLKHVIFFAVCQIDVTDIAAADNTNLYLFHFSLPRHYFAAQSSARLVTSRFGFSIKWLMECPHEL